jgi:hypothetical protein
MAIVYVQKVGEVPSDVLYTPSNYYTGTHSSLIEMHSYSS